MAWENELSHKLKFVKTTLQYGVRTVSSTSKPSASVVITVDVTKPLSAVAMKGTLQVYVVESQ